MNKIYYRGFVVLVLMLIVCLLFSYIILRTIDYFVNNGKLPSYTCEDGREVKTIIQGGHSIKMCNQGELYKERIKYYK